jgi:hypothetical protein
MSLGFHFNFNYKNHSQHTMPVITATIFLLLGLCSATPSSPLSDREIKQQQEDWWLLVVPVVVALLGTGFVATSAFFGPWVTGFLFSIPVTVFFLMFWLLPVLCAVR